MDTYKLSNNIKRKCRIDNWIKRLFLLITVICAAIIVVIVAFILFKGMIPFFKSYAIDGSIYKVNFFQFISGNKWHTGVATYGVGYVIINTIYVILLSLVFAIPLSVLSALFMARIAPKKIGSILMTIIELLASIPSIIYGLFGSGMITKFTIIISNLFHIQTKGGMSLLTVSLVLAIMIFPTITMMSTTAIKAVKKEIIHGSIALGVSKTQTNFKVVLSSAKSGIFAGVILGVGRALGEATAISMVCGNAQSGPGFSLFDSTSTLTTTILNGFTDASGLGYDIRFSVGIVLIVMILLTNFVLNSIKNKIGVIQK